MPLSSLIQFFVMIMSPRVKPMNLIWRVISGSFVFDALVTYDTQNVSCPPPSAQRLRHLNSDGPHKALAPPPYPLCGFGQITSLSEPPFLVSKMKIIPEQSPHPGMMGVAHYVMSKNQGQCRLIAFSGPWAVVHVTRVVKGRKDIGEKPKQDHESIIKESSV